MEKAQQTRLSLNTYRCHLRFVGENITFQMLEDLAKMEDKVLSGTIETSVILAKWNKHRVSEGPWKI